MKSLELPNTFGNNRGKTRPSNNSLGGCANTPGFSLSENFLSGVSAQPGEKDLRSVVARRFMWMSQVHDRIRNKLLAHQPVERDERLRRTAL